MFSSRFRTALSCRLGCWLQRPGRRATARGRRVWPVLIVGLLAVAGCDKVREPSRAPVPSAHATPPPAPPSPSLAADAGDLRIYTPTKVSYVC